MRGAYTEEEAASTYTRTRKIQLLITNILDHTWSFFPFSCQKFSA